MKDKIKDIKKEADILSKLDFKNIVKFYDSYLDKDKFYILMEYYVGLSLKDFLILCTRNDEIIEKALLYNIIKQICICIKEINNKNIIHGNLKPENIFINENMEIKIGDFDISKNFNPIRENTKTLKKSGAIYYIAPEIISKGVYNEKSDLYSLGCIIYELFSFSKYYNDRKNNEIKVIDSKKYNNKWQEIINSLLQINYNDRMDINKVYDIILNEMNFNELKNEINNIRFKYSIKEMQYSINTIKEELEDLQNNPICNIPCTVGLPEKDYFYKWRATLAGPSDTSYGGVIFILEILFNIIILLVDQVSIF